MTAGRCAAERPGVAVVGPRVGCGGSVAAGEGGGVGSDVGSAVGSGVGASVGCGVGVGPVTGPRIGGCVNGGALDSSGLPFPRGRSTGVDAEATGVVVGLGSRLVTGLAVTGADSDGATDGATDGTAEGPLVPVPPPGSADDPGPDGREVIAGPGDAEELGLAAAAWVARGPAAEIVSPGFVPGT